MKQTLTTNSDGRFVQPYLPSGMYRMTVEKAGVSKSVTSDIKIDVRSTVSLNVGLKLGEVSATIEVQADVAQRKTEPTAASMREKFAALVYSSILQ